jgi:purine-binding chemotaxis protein CheW
MKELKTEMDKSISYLVVNIRNEKYALHVSNVVNILEMEKITNIPLAPPYMKGIINLRGTALPVIDTKIKFGLEETIFTHKTCIIVLSVNVDNEEFMVGALVDSVEEVIEIEGKLIGPPPSIGTTYRSAFISGTTRIDEEFILILDFVKLFNEDELMAVVQFKNELEETANPQ